MLGGAQSLVMGLVGGITGLVGGWFGDGADAAQMREMEGELNRLREENARLVGVLQENARLRELVGFQEEYREFELLPARVIGRGLTPYFRVVKIEIQAAGELAPRMPVVAAQGLVGQIHQVYDRHADVILIADPRSRADGIVQRNRALGVVEGLGHDSDYLMRVSYLSSRDEVRPGDRIVTSGMGGVFPRELLIGEVREVLDGERGLFQEVRVAPAVDFSRIEEVFVITNLE